MAKQDNAQPAVKQSATHVLEVNGKQVELPLLGPYGDKALHGSKLCYGLGESNNKKRDAKDILHHVVVVDDVSYWAFSYWAPASDAEVLAFAKAKPANVGVLLTKALQTMGRQASWHENRGGATTVDAMVNGVLTKGIDKATILPLLLLAGHKVEIVERTRKAKTSK